MTSKYEDDPALRAEANEAYNSGRYEASLAAQLELFYRHATHLLTDIGKTVGPVTPNPEPKSILSDFQQMAVAIAEAYQEAASKPIPEDPAMKLAAAKELHHLIASSNMHKVMGEIFETLGKPIDAAAACKLVILGMNAGALTSFSEYAIPECLGEIKQSLDGAENAAKRKSWHKDAMVGMAAYIAKNSEAGKRAVDAGVEFAKEYWPDRKISGSGLEKAIQPNRHKTEFEVIAADVTAVHRDGDKAILNNPGMLDRIKTALDKVPGAKRRG